MLQQFEEYKLRKMSSADAAKVVALAINSWKLEYRTILDDSTLENLSKEPFKQGREMILKKEDCNCIVVTDQDENIIGFSDAGKSWKSEQEDKEGEIYALYVKSTHQRQSIGKKLFDEQVQYLKESGFKDMIIWTWEQNKKSRSFYEKVGGKFNQMSDKEFEGKKYATVQYKWSLR